MGGLQVHDHRPGQHAVLSDHDCPQRSTDEDQESLGGRFWRRQHHLRRFSTVSGRFAPGSLSRHSSQSICIGTSSLAQPQRRCRPSSTDAAMRRPRVRRIVSESALPCPL